MPATVPRPSLCAAATALLLLPVAARAASVDASALSASFFSDGITSRLAPQAPVSRVLNATSKPFSIAKTVPHFAATLPISDGVSELATLSVAATVEHANVKYSGMGVDVTTTEGDSSLATVEMTLAAFPPPANPPPPLLRIVARSVTDDTIAGFEVSHSVFDGRATIGALTVTGTLVGLRTLHFAGPAAKNKILFQSSDLVIALNSQNTVGLITCIVPTGCTFTPTAIATQAIAVTLTNVPIGGKPVSGTIAIGRSGIDEDVTSP